MCVVSTSRAFATVTYDPNQRGNAFHHTRQCPRNLRWCSSAQETTESPNEKSNVSGVGRKRLENFRSLPSAIIPKVAAIKADESGSNRTWCMPVNTDSNM